VKRLGTGRIHTGQVLESVTRTSSGLMDPPGQPAVFTLRNRADSTLSELSADVLVGADGIYSAVRRSFYPNGDLPRFSRRLLWRGVTEAAPYLDGRTMFMAGHQDQKFVCYPISEPLRREGRSLINWIAELRVPGTDEDTPPESDGNKRVDSRSSRIRSRTGAGTGSTSPRSSTLPKPSTNSQWSTRTPCPAGRTTASRCWAMRRIRCTRSAPTAARRPSWTRTLSP
jgi:2-polyprenyl-6-methoxyphenol hydroxylase-like FAD-dependent oxidoreductase